METFVLYDFNFVSFLTLKGSNCLHVHVQKPVEDVRKYYHTAAPAVATRTETRQSKADETYPEYLSSDQLLGLSRSQLKGTCIYPKESAGKDILF